MLEAGCQLSGTCLSAFVASLIPGAHARRTHSLPDCRRPPSASALRSHLRSSIARARSTAFLFTDPAFAGDRRRPARNGRCRRCFFKTPFNYRPGIHAASPSGSHRTDCIAPTGLAPERQQRPQDSPARIHALPRQLLQERFMPRTAWRTMVRFRDSVPLLPACATLPDFRSVVEGPDLALIVAESAFRTAFSGILAVLCSGAVPVNWQTSGKQSNSI